MKTILFIFAIICCAAVSACGTTVFGTATSQASTSSPPPHSQSTIVSKMKNYYDENSQLSIDPCHDSFIGNMEKIGYTLNAEVILPEGRQYFGYWYATCLYRSGNFSALTEASTAPIMAPEESLEAEYDIEGPSRIIDIEGRQSIVRPSVSQGRGCMVSMTTTFGSMTITGSDVRVHLSDHEGDCDRIIELLRQIEPWVND